MHRKYEEMQGGAYSLEKLTIDYWWRQIEACKKKEVVTCDFTGQLGNQLFQVAAAIGYARDHGCEARFPGLKEALGAEENVRDVFHRLDFSAAPEMSLYVEGHSHRFAPIPYEKGKGVRLKGHFVSEKYFARHAEEIRRLFAPTEEMVREIGMKYGEALEGETVAVHVRTFILDGKDPLRIGFGGGKWSYFLRAMRQFPPDAHFLVFSDDIEWTKRHFPCVGKMTFVEGNRHTFDFYLMSLCKHQIVSPESTFSWWAAWLNSNPEKKVVAPDVWGDLAEHDAVPEGWIRVGKG